MKQIDEVLATGRSGQSPWWHRLLTRRKKALPASCKTRFRPVLETLEDRTTPAVFSVTNATELIDAINTANFNNQPDTINIDPGITITLGVVNNTVNGDNGLPHIVSDNGNRLTINGNGSTLERGSFGPNIRFLSIGVNAIVTVKNLTFRNGSQIGDGGAIHNFGDLTIQSSAFRANGASGLGGAIVNQGTLTVTDTSFETNLTIFGSGGAIFNFGTATIRDSSFTGNEAQGNLGGVILNQGTLEVTGSELSNNVAETSGGALFNFGTATIRDSSFTGNEAQGNSGGAILNQGTLEVTGSILSDNVAELQGGAILNLGTATVRDSSFLGNRSRTSDGGAIFTQDSLEVIGSTFSGNTAAEFGGAIGFASGTLSILQSTITNNNFAVVRGPDVLPLVRNSIIAGNINVNIGLLAPGSSNNLIGGNPRLGPLTSIGGKPPTHALLPDSPAIDAGNNAFAPGPEDQRGFERISAGIVDIGAVEFQQPALIFPTAGSGQATTVDTAFANPLRLIASERNGVPIVNGRVVFSAPAGGTSATFAGNNQVTTDVTGRASLSASANEVAGSYAVTAALSGVGNSTSFNLTNLAGNPATITALGGDNQHTVAGANFAEPLRVLVTDTFGNPVRNVNVTFTAPTNVFAGNATVTIATNNSGIATTSELTATPTLGSFTVTATVNGVSTPAFFDLTVHAAQFHGRKFHDQNGNGQHDNGEPYLNGWTIELVDADTGVVVASQVTHSRGGEDGWYWFTVDAYGEYVIREVLQPGWVQSAPDIDPLAQQAFDLAQAHNFDYYAPRWDNWGGLQEKWIISSEGTWFILTPDGNIYAWNPNDIVRGGGLPQSLIAGAIGTVDPIHYADPSQLLVTREQLSRLHRLSIATGGVFNDLDFGNLPADTPGSIHGRKYHDGNGNGVHDDGEPYLNDWSIELVDADTLDVIATQQTHARNGEDGWYWFEDVPLDDYLIREVLQPGWLQSAPYNPLADRLQQVLDLEYFPIYDNWGGLQELWYQAADGQWYILLPDGYFLQWDNGDSLASVQANGFRASPARGMLSVEYYNDPTLLTRPQSDYYAVALTRAAQVLDGLDFGNQQYASIHGRKFEDSDGNGTRDSGEPYLNDWTIELVDALTQQVVATQVTHAFNGEDGWYWFENVLPGEYEIREVLQPGWQQTTNLDPVEQQAWQLQQQFQFVYQPIYNNWGGQSERWLQDPSGAWYVLLPDGQLWQWDDRDNQNHVLANGFSNSLANAANRIEALDAGLYQDVWRLTYASQPGTHDELVASAAQLQNRDFGNQRN